MSRKANSTAIGIFVVGAAALVVAGITYFGSGRFLAETETYVLFFEGSLKGLNVGAPVLFRGVKVGEVSDIVVRYHEDDQKIDIPVYIEYRPDTVVKISGTPDRRATIAALVEQGLRAKLAMQSFVTGLLAVEFEFKPESPVRLVGGDPRYTELPTIPSMMDELSNTMGKFAHRLSEIPIEGLISELREAVQGTNEFVRSEELKQAVKSLDETLKDFGKLARKVDEKVDPLVSSFVETSEAARATFKTADERIVSAEGVLSETLGSYKTLAENTDTRLEPLATSITDTAEVARTALEQARQTLATVQEVIARDSELHYKLIGALEEFSAAAHSVRVLADYLEQNPEALLQGKNAPGGK
ncbi:MAG: MCE family protein [Phycisphaerales bacterium]|nr:MAG: MCE family protein [Phycisphaerales bacterium]